MLSKVLLHYASSKMRKTLLAINTCNRMLLSKSPISSLFMYNHSLFMYNHSLFIYNHSLFIYSSNLFIYSSNLFTATSNLFTVSMRRPVILHRSIPPTKIMS